MAEEDPSSQSRSAVIDESSISPTRTHVRQNSLEKHLQHRPDQQELKDRHILLDTNAAPALQAAAYDLERQRATDSLKKNLEHRAQREDLVERNVLSPTTAAPAIQSQQRDLERNMRADSLNEKIAQRPSPGSLIEGGILMEDPTSMTDGKKEGGNGGNASTVAVASSSEGQAQRDREYEERMEDEYAKREGGA